MLVNEVTTGIGRTGKWFGYQHYGLEPDIVAMGKGIGNGYPVAVCALSPRVGKLLGDRPVPWAQSHQNDPLGAAVAQEVLRTIREEKLIERGRKVARHLLAGLTDIARSTEKIKEIRARGLMLAVELRDDSSTSWTIQVHEELVERGFFVCRRPGTGTLRLDPALTVEISDIDDFLQVFEDVLASNDQR
jgi:acetylornithine aminotransferase